jgi:hypothetical protein
MRIRPEATLEKQKRLNSRKADISGGVETRWRACHCKQCLNTGKMARLSQAPRTGLQNKDVKRVSTWQNPKVNRQKKYNWLINR